MPMDQLYDKPGHLIRRAQQIAWALFMAECAPFDITSVQYAALFAVRENPGIDATRLSALVAFDRSTLGLVVERLEAKGLIERSGDPKDKRIKLLHLTLQGRRILREIEPAVERAQKRILAPLKPEQRRQFVNLLSQLVHLNNDLARAPLRALDRTAG
ncbi:MAG: MarR family transcriptional regulator [Methylobacteriaceae bacterium]|nr:MarR family transcriptional regulator [Methylobacteriaceae bacterium]